MKNHNRLYHLLAAGSLTVLLLLTFLLFQNNRFWGVADAATTTVTETLALPASGAVVNGAVTSAAQTDATQTLEALQAQNQQLLQAVQVMQEREQQYQTQLNNASQALQTIQEQNSTSLFSRRGHEEHESGEHELGEHELGEHDDD